MTLLDRVHELAAKIGLSPKVFDPLVLAILAAVVSLILTGTIDLSGVKLAAAALLYAIVSGLAPPALAIDQAALNETAKAEAARRKR